MVENFDLIVIGTGSAGSAAASKCSKAGWKVAIIDSRPFGGTCSLRGCDPKKVLVGAAELIDGIHRMKGNGVTAGSDLDWSELMAFKRIFTEPVPDSREKNFQKAGIQAFHGRASFLSEDQIQVGDDILTGKHILIANGAKPAPLAIEGTEHLTYSDEFLELDELPAKLVFIGGGYISFEFAHIAARAGSEVHIIHRGKRPLEHFESELVDLLMEKSEEVGIHLHLETEVKSIEKNGAFYTVTGVNDGQQVHFEGGLVLHGAGRMPDLEDMQLEKGNVEREKRGVAVNEFLQSRSNPRVYAAGDAAATEGLPLTPIASMESHVVASNLLKKNHRSPNYKVMPTVVFTLPKLASVGLSEEQAREKGHQIKVNKMETSDWYTYKRTNEKYAMVKVIIDEESDKILGAHLISHEADELINHFATAIQFNLTTKDLKQMIYAYPTAASDLGYMV
ncbi:NAD(P)/FAD-dependent oxidoreductase [Exiguobacterium sp. s102]|uniref:dihydrolipoyl dehydrogenase family protein n=1 Tax=Exiguobacterium sp. s102 TaxID=2751212 RepID=UPI001BE6F61B|nr:NAD(P)/FAD-dependent oxidoreductase [Exiguobacterium sp. s102]